MIHLEQKKLTQTKQEHNKKEVQTLISLKLVFAFLITIIMSNLQQHGFLLITKTRKAREVLNYPRGGGEAYNQMYFLFTGR